MSIVIKENSGECEYANQDCFYCGKKLKFPFIHWFGSSGHIYLHPDCIDKFSVKLLYDKFLLEVLYGSKPNHRR